MDNKILELVDKAKKMANSNTCCQHSAFTVGAILVTEDDKEYSGFNVENHGINSICAERVAFVKALSEGEKNFKYIVVVGKKQSDELFNKALPCGFCRQFMSEYANKDFLIYTYVDKDEKLYKYTLEELLPESFEL